MEQTLGKRIVSHRKRLGLTQDQLAEQLGLTAQAVSKWENDQSCPDITILPKLARIFGITTDALLGIEPEPPVRQGELVKSGETEPQGFHAQSDNGNWELQWNGGRKSGVALAALVLLVGILLMAGIFLHWNVSFWGLLWPCALLVFGVCGLYPRFRFFRLGCALFGGYFLADSLGLLPVSFGRDLVFPAVLILFGLSLLAEALRKSGKPGFHIHRKDKNGGKFCSSCDISGEHFRCETAFGDDQRVISLPRLSGGSINCSFGDLTVDLTTCEEAAAGCHLDADCSFGSVTILMPRRFRAEAVENASFGSVEISGHPDPGAAPIVMDCEVSFGSIRIQYV